MSYSGSESGIRRLSGQTVVGELLRNMELGRFELAFSVLLPCVFSVYLHPEDHTRLSGVFPLLIEDARKAFRARVAELNSRRNLLGVKVGKPPKEYKIACSDWVVEFLANAEVPPGDIEIHSELNEAADPGYRGTKTTLIGREPSVVSDRRGVGSTTTIETGPIAPRAGKPSDTNFPPLNHVPTAANPTRRVADRVFGEIKYEDDSGPQVYLVTRNRVAIGRGGDGNLMDLALYASDDVSREHLWIERDPATGAFSLTDKSTNGTWLNGKRLRRGEPELLPESAEINLAEVLRLQFKSRT